MTPAVGTGVAGPRRAHQLDRAPGLTGLAHGAGDPISAVSELLPDGDTRAVVADRDVEAPEGAARAAGDVSGQVRHGRLDPRAAGACRAVAAAHAARRNRQALAEVGLAPDDGESGIRAGGDREPGPLARGESRGDGPGVPGAAGRPVRRFDAAHLAAAGPPRDRDKAPVGRGVEDAAGPAGHELALAPVPAVRPRVGRRLALVRPDHGHAAVSTRLERRDARAAPDRADDVRRAPGAARRTRRRADDVVALVVAVGEPRGDELAVGHGRDARRHTGGDHELGLEVLRRAPGAAARAEGGVDLAPRAQPDRHRVAGGAAGDPRWGGERVGRLAALAGQPLRHAMAPAGRNTKSVAATSAAVRNARRIAITADYLVPGGRTQTPDYVSGPACACVHSDGKPWESRPARRVGRDHGHRDAEGLDPLGKRVAMPVLVVLGRRARAGSRRIRRAPPAPPIVAAASSPQSTSVTGWSPAARCTRRSASSGVQSGASGWRSGGTMSAIWQPARARCLTSSSNRGADSVRLATTSSRRDEGSVMA